MNRTIYLIGSLRNSEIPRIGNFLRNLGYDVFDDWFAGGKIADDSWRDYEKARGHTFKEALRGYAARHVFNFDRHHLDRCDVGVLVMPAGKSGHIEMGYLIGQGKPVYVLLDHPKRWDVMYCFADGVFNSVEELGEALGEGSNSAGAMG
mgnify:CR=1 FL=1